MDNFLKTLSKPAKWILVIGSFIYAAWFAVQQAGSIDGEFMSVMTHIIILVVGTALLLATPILILMNKEEQAKIAFVILVGYWLISNILSWFGMAEALCSRGADGLSIVTGIFSFIGGLCLVGILVLIVLEYALKNKGLRLFAFFALLGVIAFGFITGILYLIEAIKMQAGWVMIVDGIFDYLLLPLLVCFGYLHFFGAPSGKKGN